MSENMPMDSGKETIAERNTARLLARAYRPEVPAEGFMEDVKESMRAARATAGRGFWSGSRVRWAVAAAALVVVGVGLYVVAAQREAGYRRDGNTVWIDGAAYRLVKPTPTSVPLGDGTGGGGGAVVAGGGEQATVRPEEAQPARVPFEPGYRRKWDTVWIAGGAYKPEKKPATTSAPAGNGNAAAAVVAANKDEGKMTARPAGTRPATEVADSGTTITTGAGQRRRVALADGSVLYVNQKTSLKIEGERRVTLDSGEAYFEVSPRQGRQGVATVADPTFLVKTPGRKVAALGTHFDVAVKEDGTRVMVTQGRVDVDGMDVYSGEELPAEKTADNPGVQTTLRASVVLDWMRDLVAAAQSPLVPASAYDGGALVVVDPWGQESRLEMRNYAIDVYIEDGFARTTIDQTYFNSSYGRTEGTFYFPLPADASLSRLAMYVDGTLMEGGMCEREAAREVYETVLYQRKDPALLEWVDGTTFKMRVFPIEGRQEKRIILSYTQKLDSLYGEAQYRFAGGHSMNQVRDWSFKARVKEGATTQWLSDNQVLEATKDGGDLVLSAKAHQVRPNQDVVLRLGARAAAVEDQARFAMMTYEGRRYLMVRAMPALAGEAKHERRDWVFLFEASGARDPVLARAQVEIVRTILENVEHDDTIAVVTAGAHANAMGDPMPATSENVAAAVAYLEQTHLVGALDLGQALDATVRFVKAGKNPYLVHVGTGIGVLGERSADELAKRVPAGAKYVGIGVGKSWSRQFMKAAAARTGGYFAQINPDEEISWRAFDLLATLNAPRLMNVNVVEASENLTFLGFTDAVAQGEEYCAIARFPEGAAMPKDVALTGVLDGKPYRQVFEVKDVWENAGYLPRMWAKLEIDRLLAAGSEANKAAVISLSKDMYVMSPFTSLLVLENEAMYAQYHVDRGRKDHWAMYAAPEKIAVATENEAGRADPATQAGARKTMEEALGSVLVRTAPEGVNWPNRVRYFAAGTTVTARDSIFGGMANQQAVAVLDSNGNITTIRSMPYLSLQDLDADEKRSRIRLKYELGIHEFDGGLLSTWDWSPTVTITGGGGTGVTSYGGLVFNNSGGWTKLGTGTLTLTGAMTYTGPTYITNGVLTMSGGGLMPGAPAVLNLNGGILTVGSLESRGGVWITNPGVGYSIDRSQPIMNFNGGLLRATPSVSLAGSTAAYVWNGGYGGYGGGAGFGGMGGHGDGAFGGNIISGSGALFLSPTVTYAAGPAQYQRPSFANDWRAFGDLLQFAPGMNTSWADVRAVLDAEAAADPDAAPGKIEPAARALIERARKAGWQSVRVVQGPRQEAFTVTFDAQGRYRYERTLSEGLRETAVCDGTTLTQLYPDIGVGARRTVSRFHREELSALVPWVVQPAEDLARGNDVTVVAGRTVQIAPAGAAQRKDAEGKPATYVALQLVFAEDGRLAERRWVELPTGKVLGFETYSAAGVVRVCDESGKELRKVDLGAKEASAPGLAADTRELVVLPMPLRDRATLVQTENATDLTRADFAKNWPEEKALALIGADLGNRPAEVVNIVGARFFARGDRRIGFYTLLTASQNNMTRNMSVWVDGKAVNFDPVTDHQGSALAQYLVEQWQLQQQGKAATLSAVGGKDDFVSRLAAIREAVASLQRGGSNESVRTTATGLMLKAKDPMLAWTLWAAAANYGGGPDYYRALAEGAKSLENAPGLYFMARYEEAQALDASGTEENKASAKGKFVDLYVEATSAGMLPAVNPEFYNAVHAGDGGEWVKLMRETGATLREKGGRTAAVYQAWQCRQLGDAGLADELFAAALEKVPESEHVPTTVAAVNYLLSAGQTARAAKMLDGLLEDPKAGASPASWQAAAQLALSRDMVAQGLKYQERAMDMEFANLPSVVNVQALRAEYGQAMYQYERLATAMATLNETPPAELIGRVIRTADRWRALDPDKTGACQAAARVFTALNLPELAWEYETTPLAEKSNEAQPWVNLAQLMRQRADWTLADQAYATAFEVEPTNAQVLYDRAMMLQETQRFGEARKLMQQLADGNWEPRFSSLQLQAKNYVQNH